MSARLAPLCLLLCLAACGSSPKTRFYALEPLPSTQLPSVRAPTAPVVVDHVELPSMLDRLSLVTEGPGNQISVSDTDRWASPLDEQVRRTLTADLRQHLSAGSVLAAGDPTPAGTRTITLNVQQFVANANGQVTLDADWSLHGGKTTNAVRHVRIHVAPQGQGGDAIAASMSRALAQLADRMSAEL
jgi:uncharacterized lipoprotein YmbA